MAKRAASLHTRLLRVAAWVVYTMGPARCTCEDSRRRGYSHAPTCLRWVHVRLQALFQKHGLEPYGDDSMDRVMAALEEAEAGGTQGGAEAVWKGGGMDAQVDAWFRRELVRCRNERHERRRRGQATTALGARRKALRDVRKALAHYARDGEQIVDMTQEGAA